MGCTCTHFYTPNTNKATTKLGIKHEALNTLVRFATPKPTLAHAAHACRAHTQNAADSGSAMPCFALPEHAK